MKNLKTAMFAFAVLFALTALAPATVEAAPPKCSCSYCDENPEQWCSFLGYTNTCNLFLALWCDGGFFAAQTAGVNQAADSCSVTSEDLSQETATVEEEPATEATEISAPKAVEARGAEAK